jgi:hypothetical protein
MKEDGGRAFPQGVGADYELLGGEGMSLRDYFAAHAPHPDVGQTMQMYHRAQPTASPTEASEAIVTQYAQWAYLYADAMLAARLK